jgi:hypothetical protein
MRDPDGLVQPPPPPPAAEVVLYTQSFDAGASCVQAGWTKMDLSGAGQYMGLFKGFSQVQQDKCDLNLSCVWAAISGSTETYACGGFPGQIAVPKGNVLGQYVNNEIWSPIIAGPGVFGSEVRLEFTVYRDNPVDDLVFYKWHVRTIDAGGVPGAWRDLGFVYYGGKGWLRQTQSVGAFLDLAPGNSIQIALGVVDRCGDWCGVYGTGSCHSHAPLLDSVTLTQVLTFGPQWAIRDIDQFQDNFSSDGSSTGTVRADMAKDIRPAMNPFIVPGDSAVVTVSDPSFALAVDPFVGGDAVYMFVTVKPPGQPGKSGDALSGDLVRWPHVAPKDFVDAAGVPWTCLRLDPVIPAVPNTFCIDLNDDLFEPGDMVCFFYSAVDGGFFSTTYAFGSDLSATGAVLAEAAANPSEFTCLPTGHGGDILYVDGMDGRGAQPLWDSAFEILGIGEVDRYDIRGPSSGVNNGLGSRVVNVQTQLNDFYRKILWDCGDLSVTLGDGGATFPGHKTDDYNLINTFLDNLQVQGGVYVCGDDVALQLTRLVGASAVTFKSTYITYTLTTGNQVPSYGIAPLGRGITGRCFNNDVFVVYGGCPLINDFDVIAPTGMSLMEVTYGPPAANNGAVISKVTNNSHGVDVGVLLSGFAFEYIRDDESDGIADRMDHLHDILLWLGNVVGQPVDVTPVRENSLSQNYPNPFNPQTTIAFALKERGPVSLKIYGVSGELVRTLANEELGAGPHTKVWDGRDDSGQTVSSGVYFYRLAAKNFTQTRKMVALK